MDVKFDHTFWKRGRFPNYYVNGTQTLPLTNPWYSSPEQNAPFDQCLYYSTPRKHPGSQTVCRDG
jgi:hypothetical protein